MSNVIEFKPVLKAHQKAVKESEKLQNTQDAEVEMFGTTAESIDSMIESVGTQRALLMLTRSLRTMADLEDYKSLYQIANVIDYLADSYLE